MAPISLGNGSLGFGEGEVVVEYAVKMRCLPEKGFLLRRLVEGRLRRADLDRIAATREAFCHTATASGEAAGWARVGRLQLSTDKHFRQIEPFVCKAHSRPSRDTLRYLTNRFYDRTSRLVNRRRDEGYIRDCHGDLHLEHIHLTSNRVRIYDCNAFSEGRRYIDAASDLAFLSMDLDRHGRSDPSQHLVRHMATLLRDEDLPRPKPFLSMLPGGRALKGGKHTCH